MALLEAAYEHEILKACGTDIASVGTAACYTTLVFFIGANRVIAEPRENGESYRNPNIFLCI